MVQYLLKYASAIAFVVAVSVAGFGGYQYAKNSCDKREAIADSVAKEKVIESVKGASDVKKTVKRMPSSDVHKRLLAKWSRD